MLRKQWSPELTWRDVQHLIANTAQIPNPKEPGWNINAAGYHVHHSDYGTVLLEADQHTDPELSSTGHKGRETDESGDPDPGDFDVSVLGGSVCTFLTLLADGVNINRERTREGPQNKK
ncbi:hypothetical protein JOQ06_025667 [Pogonophryne albipinna]|uniref:Uncharacterized protein n=1 Tax=Pogonophryne albipinna TaxID=1090488 RepID=A0AAD6FF44_9TELE|nr:hypothetical protein JOQ06_025667 [Pogonophryne albipinna]